MSYTWTNGEVITAEKLNATGGSGGGYDLVIGALYNTSTHELTLDKTYSEIKTAIQNDNSIIVKFATDEYPTAHYLLYLAYFSEYGDAADFFGVPGVNQHSIDQDYIYIDFANNAAYYTLRRYEGNS